MLSHCAWEDFWRRKQGLRGGDARRLLLAGRARRGLTQLLEHLQHSDNRPGFALLGATGIIIRAYVRVY